MGDPTTDELERLICYLKRSFHLTTPEEIIGRWQRGEKAKPYSLMLTFDDGYREMRADLLPLLRKHRVPATVFLPTGPVNGNAAWFQKLIASIVRTSLSELPPVLGLPAMSLKTVQDRIDAIDRIASLQLKVAAEYWDDAVCRVAEAAEWDGELGGEQSLTWDEVRELRDSGWVLIGGHTVTHPLLAACGHERSRREIEECADHLRENLGPGFRPFAYPNGRLTEWAAEMVRFAGFDCAFTSHPSCNSSIEAAFALGRHHVSASDLSAAALGIFQMSSNRPPNANSSLLPTKRLASQSPVDAGA
jgi:peptidoglycan/xylan/chitin deacetylase (PgdA/CDA1 family)